MKKIASATSGVSLLFILGIVGSLDTGRMSIGAGIAAIGIALAVLAVSVGVRK